MGGALIQEDWWPHKKGKRERERERDLFPNIPTEDKAT